MPTIGLLTYMSAKVKHYDVSKSDGSFIGEQPASVVHGFFPGEISTLQPRRPPTRLSRLVGRWHQLIVSAGRMAAWPRPR